MMGRMRRAAFAKLFLAALFVTGSLASYAAECHVEFRRLYEASLDASRPCAYYKADRCQFNVVNVATELENSGVDLSLAHVVVFVAEERKFVGVPVKTKLSPDPTQNRGKDNEWHYHVVLEDGGKFWDLDSGPEGYLPSDFVGRVFPNNAEYPHRPEKLYVRRIPLAQYRAIIAEPETRYNSPLKKLVSYYDDSPEFPLRSFADTFTAQ